MDNLKISFSILNCDFFNLSKSLNQAQQAGVDMLHLDVMDGHFVPNLSIGPYVIRSLKEKCSLFFDVHLMVDNPDCLLDSFIESGADLITVHAEVCPHLQHTLARINKAGIKAGVALNPSTPIYCLEHVMDQLDLILVMTVNPGFGGQQFIPAMEDKIAKVSGLVENYQLQQDKKKRIEIQVDGGIGLDTASRAVYAGATVLVMGTSLCNAPDMAVYLKQLRENIKSG
ncbi:MAG: ribulose-phosphate 3-epimerase [Actinomycetota bacterium]|jgi:ribulose-phosphate 3-epimerase|nr:ribulose-phosphate 3-epimerase [Actinomycetota bacterium]